MLFRSLARVLFILFSFVLSSFVRFDLYILKSRFHCCLLLISFYVCVEQQNAVSLSVTVQTLEIGFDEQNLIQLYDLLYRYTSNFLLNRMRVDAWISVQRVCIEMDAFSLGSEKLQNCSPVSSLQIGVCYSHKYVGWLKKRDWKCQAFLIVFNHFQSISIFH